MSLVILDLKSRIPKWEFRNLESRNRNSEISNLKGEKKQQNLGDVFPACLSSLVMVATLSVMFAILLVMVAILAVMVAILLVMDAILSVMFAILLVMVAILSVMVAILLLMDAILSVMVAILLVMDASLCGL